MKDLYQAILKRRTIRIFHPAEIPRRIIRKLIEAARRAPSAANLQFLEYLVIDREDLKEKIFPCTKWAGYIYPKRVPSKENRPSFYIIILINKNKSQRYDLRDVGAAVENILLALLYFGLGGCWIASIKRRKVRTLFNIPSHYKIDSLVACGLPAEEPILEESSTNVKYWLDSKNRLHIPKRPLSEITHWNKINS